MSSTKRWALMHELRGADEPRLPELLAKMSQVDLVIVEGFQARAAPQDRGASRRQLQSRCCSPTIPASSASPPTQRLKPRFRPPISTMSPRVAAMMRSARRSSVEDVLAEERKRELRVEMAQLSDDCFAFGGPMMSVDEAVGLIARAGHRGAWTSRPLRLPMPMAAFSRTTLRRRCRCRLSPIPPSMAMRVCEPRSAAKARRRLSHDRARAGRRVGASGRSGPATRCASSRARRCLRAPTPCSCRRTSASKASKVVLPAGLKPGANVRPAGEDIPLGHAALSAGQRLRPQDVALAAAFGLTQLDVIRRIRVAVFSTGNELVSPGERRARAATVRFQPLHADGDAAPARLRGQPISASCATSARRCRERLEGGGGSHDLILTTGGVSTGEEDHVKAGVESVGRLVLWRMAIKPGRPVAMGIIGGTPFIGLAGKSGGEFCHLRPRGAADHSGAVRRAI